jgi:hypothetical protein
VLVFTVDKKNLSSRPWLFLSFKSPGDFLPFFHPYILILSFSHPCSSVIFYFLASQHMPSPFLLLFIMLFFQSFSFLSPLYRVALFFYLLAISNLRPPRSWPFLPLVCDCLCLSVALCVCVGVCVWVCVCVSPEYDYPCMMRSVAGLVLSIISREGGGTVRNYTSRYIVTRFVIFLHMHDILTFLHSAMCFRTFPSTVTDFAGTV